MLQAQELGVTFGPDEDYPDRALVQMASVCAKRIDSLMQDAGDHQVMASTDPARCRKAEDCLSQARQLAVGFGLDTQLIDSKLAAARQIRLAGMASAPAPGMMVPPGSNGFVLPPDAAHVQVSKGMELPPPDAAQSQVSKGMDVAPVAVADPAKQGQ